MVRGGRSRRSVYIPKFESTVAVVCVGGMEGEEVIITSKEVGTIDELSR